MKKLYFFLVFTLILLTSNSQIYSHEIFDNIPARWSRQNYDFTLHHNYCYANVWASSTVKDNLKLSNYTTGISNWNSYSSGYIRLTDVSSISSSNIDMTAFVFPTLIKKTVLGICLNYDTDGQAQIKNTNLSSLDQDPNTSFNGLINYTNICFNTYLTDNTNTTSVIKIVTHELGHAFGLGHPSTSTQSVMHPGTVLGWHNYDRPQAHDRNDLANFY